MSSVWLVFWFAILFDPMVETRSHTFLPNPRSTSKQPKNRSLPRWKHLVPL